MEISRVQEVMSSAIEVAWAMLDRHIVYEMRRMRAEENWTCQQIADKFGVTDERVRTVVTVQAWKSVKTPFDAFLIKNRVRLGYRYLRLPRGGLTYDLAIEYFRYDPMEGILKWNVRAQGVEFGERAGSLNSGSGHFEVRVGGYRYYTHRIIWLYMTGNWPKHFIDHIDGNRINDKWDNLREATQSQNAMNSKIRTDNTTGIKGVSRLKTNGKYRAYIQAGGRHMTLGEYQTLEEAADVRRKAEEKYHGEFARNYA